MAINGLGSAQRAYDLQTPEEDSFSDYFDNLSSDECKELAIEFIEKVNGSHCHVTESKEFEVWLRKKHEGSC